MIKTAASTTKESNTRFPRAKFSIRFGEWLWLYIRHANCASIGIGFIHVVVPMSWLPEAAYQKGWDACWRNFQHIESAPPNAAKAERLDALNRLHAIGHQREELERTIQALTGANFKLAESEAEWQAHAAMLTMACEQLISYRDRAGAINWQLEKADDYHRMIRAAISATPAEALARLKALEAIYERVLLFDQIKAVVGFELLAVVEAKKAAEDSQKSGQ